MRSRMIRFGKFLQCLLVLTLLTVLTGPASANGGSTLFLPVILNNAGPGTITGTVFDAIGRAPLQGASVCYASRCATTNASGVYTLTNIFSGYKTFQASLSGYISASGSVTVKTNQTVILNFVLTAVDFSATSDADYRVIITWDPTPSFGGFQNNMDANLWVNLPGFDIFHVWYYCPQPYVDPPYSPSNPYPNDDCLYFKGDTTGFPYARLSYDYVEGFGPETMDISTEPISQTNVVYDFAVFNEPFGQVGVPHISALSVKVVIYNKNGVYKTYDVPSLPPPPYNNGINQTDVWYVFQMNADGVVTDKNCFAFWNNDTIPTCISP